MSWRSWRRLERQEVKYAWLRRRARVLLRGLLRYLRTSRPIIKENAIHDASLHSTATARTCRVLFSKARSKRWPRMTWWLGQPMTEATISSGQKLLIRRFSQATEWAPAARSRDFCRAHESLT